MANEILSAKGLTKRYGHHLAVDHADLSITQGQIYGLVGRNGAGKTTIIPCPGPAPAPGPWWRPLASTPT